MVLHFAEQQLISANNLLRKEMPLILPIRFYPDPVLRESAKPISEITPELVKLAEDMRETMYESNGVGLAANQVGVLQRIITLDASPERSKFFAIINPMIISASGRQSASEGCLSFPGIYAEEERAARVVVAGQLLDGEEVEIEADGLLARAFQHEIDHLDGVVFVDRLSPSERFGIKDQLRLLEERFEPVK